MTERKTAGAAAATAEPTSLMETKENKTSIDESMGTTRLVTKQDGSKVPFDEDVLKRSLESQMTGLN